MMQKFFILLFVLLQYLSGSQAQLSGCNGSPPEKYPCCLDSFANNVGSYSLSSAPTFETCPVLSCTQACAYVFGGNASSYHCSVTSSSLELSAYMTFYLSPHCVNVLDSYLLNTYYDCGKFHCSGSAYCNDECSETNFCYTTITSYIDEFFRDCPQPLQQVPKGQVISLANRGTISDDADGYQVVNPITGYTVYTAGNTYTIFSDLNYVYTYEFSTCSRTTGPYSQAFDTYLVLRDPFGNVLASNHQCDEEASSCSYITYTHYGTTFNEVYLSVYAVTKSYTCDYQYGNPYSPTFDNDRKVRKVYLYFGILTDSTAETTSICDYAPELTCTTDPISIAYNVAPALNDFASVNLCGQSGLVLDYSFNGEEPSPALDIHTDDLVSDYEFTCDNVGENNVTFTLFDYQCTVNFTIYDPYFADSILNCAAIYDGYNYNYPLFVRDPLQICKFGDICAADYQATPPPVYFTNEICNQENVTFSYTSYIEHRYYYLEDIVEGFSGQGNQAYIGDLVTYTINAYDTFGDIISTECFSKVSGGQFLVIEEEDGYVSLNNGDHIYYDTHYIAGIFLILQPPVDTESSVYAYICKAGISPSYADQFGYAYELTTTLVYGGRTGYYEIIFEIPSSDFGYFGNTEIQLFFKVPMQSSGESEGDDVYPLAPDHIFPGVTPHFSKRVNGDGGSNFTFYSVANPILFLTESPNNIVAEN